MPTSNVVGQGIPLEQGDQIRFNGRTSGAAITLSLSINVLLPDGTVAASTSGPCTPGQGAGLRGSGTSGFFNGLPAGTLVSAAFDIVSGPGATRPGIIYCEAYLLRSGSTVAQLIGDWTYAGHTAAYPGSIVGMSDFSKPGNIRIIAFADPAAGSEIAPVAVPTSAVWRVRSLTVQLVQGITQSPVPSLQFRSLGATKIAQIPVTGTALGASSTAQLTWGLELNQTSFSTVVGDEMHTQAIPDMILVATDDVSTLTDGIGANTDYGVAQMQVEEWFAG